MRTAAVSVPFLSAVVTFCIFHAVTSESVELLIFLTALKERKKEREKIKRIRRLNTKRVFHTTRDK